MQVTAHPLSLRALEEPPLLSTEEVKARAARVVSERTGLVESVEIVETGPCDPRAYWVRVTQANTAPLFGTRAYNDGNAAAVDVDTALLKAIGESIERYCAAAVDPEALRLAAFDALDGAAVSPSAWALFSDAQYGRDGFPVPRFTAGTPVRWTLGHSLTHDRPVWVPAGFVHIPYQPAPDETRIVPWQVSTGLACHTSLARASLKALLEVVERDAFMLFWHRQIRCPEVDVSSITDPRLRSLLARTEVPGYRRHILSLTLDLPISILLVALTSDEHKPYAVMGCAADGDPGNALRLALEEALLSLHGITTIAEREPVYTPAAGDYDDLHDLLRHAWVYGVDSRLRPVIARQFAPAGQVAFAALPRCPERATVAQLAWLVRRLEERGHEAIVVDLTTIDIDDVGFKVVRGLVPGFQPLDVDHRQVHLGGPRLSLEAARLGLTEDRCPVGPLNPFPHPFP